VRAERSKTRRKGGKRGVLILLFRKKGGEGALFHQTAEKKGERGRERSKCFFFSPRKGGKGGAPSLINGRGKKGGCLFPTDPLKREEGKGRRRTGFCIL